jgi:hypothetical protein
MSKTTQSSSWVTLSEEGKDLTMQKPETEDNMSLLLSVYDSLNILCEKLSRLDYVLTRRNLEQILDLKCRGDRK